MGCHFLLQGIFQAQGSNPGLLHCRQILLPSEPPEKSLPAPPRPWSKPKHPSDSCKRLLDSLLNGSQTGLLRGARHQHPDTDRELQGGSQSLGHPAQGPEEESVGGADGGGPPRSSLMGRICGHMQAQEDCGLFPGAPGQGS